MCSYPWPSSLLIVTSFLILWQSPIVMMEPPQGEVVYATTTAAPQMALFMSTTGEAGFSASIDLPKGMTTQPMWVKLFKTKEGPGQRDDYHPHDGYQPYWHDGDWVFNNPKEQKNNESMCNSDCHPMYQQYGQICASEAANLPYPKYKTFKDYCAMVSEDCDRQNGWSIVYRGECVTGETPIPLIKTTAIDDRWERWSKFPSIYFSEYENKNFTTISGRKQKIMLQNFLNSLKKQNTEANSVKPHQPRGPTGGNSFRRKGHTKYHQKLLSVTKHGLDHQTHVL